jgi:hypothetical protein
VLCCSLGNYPLFFASPSLFDGVFETFRQKGGVSDLPIRESTPEETPVSYFVFLMSEVLKAPAYRTESVQVPLL